MRADDHVHAAVGGRALHLRVEAEHLRDEVEGVLEVKLGVAHDFIVGIGEHGRHEAHEVAGAAGTERTHETGDGEGRAALGAGVERKQEAGEALLHLLVGKAETVLPELRVVALDGEVAALVDDGDGVAREGVDAVEHVGRGHLLGEVGQDVVVALQEPDEIGGRARLEPVAAEFQLAEGVEQAEGVVDADAVLAEVVAVVLIPEPGERLLLRQPLPVGQLADGGLEIGVYLLLRDAAESLVAFVHREVEEVVEVGENAYLPELRHPCEQGEADVLVLRFEDGIESLERGTVFGLQGFIVQRLQQGLVVFIHEDDRPLPGLFRSPPYNAFEAQGKCCLRRLAAIGFFPCRQCVIENLVKTFLAVISCRVQVEVQDGAGRPGRLQLLHRQPAEQLAPAGEVGLEGGNEQALAETARAAEEVVSSLHDQLMDHGRLVHVGVTVLAQTFKVLYSDRVFHRLFLPGLVDTANLHKNCDL